jgi:hypothetical protein
MIPFMVRLRRRLSRELDALAPSTIFGNGVVLLQSETFREPHTEAPKPKPPSNKVSTFRGKGIWPPPVYCAELETGEIARLSFWSRRGKPLDFDRGRHSVATIYRDTSLDLPRTPAAFRGTDYMAMPARLVRGWVEIDGKNYLDPHFTNHGPGYEMLTTSKLNGKPNGN